jgi:uncharacterized membrane protein
LALLSGFLPGMGIAVYLGGMSKVLLFFSALFLLSACDFHAQSKMVFEDHREPTSGQRSGGGISKTTEAAIGFATVKAQVLSACVKCHSAKTEREDEDKKDLSSYRAAMRMVTPGSLEKSKVWTELQGNGGKMPKKAGPLDVNQLAVLRQWILNGAPEVAQPPSRGVPAEPVHPTVDGVEKKKTPVPVIEIDSSSELARFDSILKNVITAKCAKCHSGDEPKGDTTIEGFNDMWAVVEPGAPDKSTFYTEIQEGSMPPPRAIESGKVQAVTPEELAGIKLWIESGAHL